MIAMGIEEVAEAAGGVIVTGSEPVDITGMSVAAVGTDSRVQTPDGLFVAIKGERTDGHAHLADAAAKGFIAALVDHVVDGAPLLQIEVTDTVEALGKLARHNIDRRRAMGSPFAIIALTGSVGKTTTKDLTQAILSTTADVVAPVGSFNNEIGLPLTALRVSESTRYFVAEMGASHIGEIRSLTQIAPPDTGIELKVGTAHVGEFGSVENIFRAKSELVEALPDSGTALLNAGDANVARMASGTAAAVRWFGLEGTQRFDGEQTSGGERAPLYASARNISTDALDRPAFDLLFDGENVGRVSLQLSGEHNVINAVAAAAAARSVGLDAASIVAALSGVASISPHRMAVSEVALADSGAHFTLVDDTFNANFDSMSAALAGLAAMATASSERPASVAVLGPMFELGQEGERIHRAIGQAAAKKGIDTLIAVQTSDPEGQRLVNSYVEGAREATRPAGAAAIDIHVVPDADCAYDELTKAAARAAGSHTPMIALLKGSHASGLGTLADRLVRESAGHSHHTLQGGVA